MNNPVYVTGHKNPDCDSIVSAIAYAEYKKNKGINAVAGRIGHVSSDVEYLLERFHYEDPLHLYTAKSTISEIDYDVATLVSKKITIKEALKKLMNTVTKTIFVVENNKRLEGLLSLSNLNELWTANERQLASLLKNATLKNVVKILDAKVLNKADNFTINGYIDLLPVNKNKIKENDIVLLPYLNEDYLKEAIDAKAGLIIICGNKDENKLDIDDNINIISTDLNPLKISKLIYQTPTIEHIMLSADKVNSVGLNETVDVCLSRISKTRFRSYPILDENKKVVGSLSRYHLNNYKKKQLILVDHNEKKQSIDDVDAGEVIEIIDHHRFGDFESDNPISIYTEVLGATATIIAKKYLDEEMKISKNLAGILLGAILSDTMNFLSPTTTEVDKQIAGTLEKISGVDKDELYQEMIKHEESIQNRRSIDILYDDYKEYEINNNKVGISQAVCKDEKDFLAVKDALVAALKDACKSRRFDLMICMLTNPNGTGSYLIAVGDKKEIIEEMYPDRRKYNFVNKLMSRKKQLLPDIIKVLS